MPRRASRKARNALSGPTLSSTPAPSTSHPPPPPASFSSLPPELKLKIAEHVRATDETDLHTRGRRREAFEDAQVNGSMLLGDVRGMLLREGKPSRKGLAKMMNELVAKAVPCRTGLSALSLVDREMYLICRPMLWEHLDLTDRTCASLITFIRDILPRQGPLVSSLKYDLDSLLSTSGLDYVDEQSFPAQDKKVVKAAERIAGVKPQGRLLARRLRTPDLLVSHVVKRLPSLQKLHARSLYPDEYGIDELSANWREHSLAAVVEARPKLTSLNYWFDEAAVQGNRRLIQVLQNSPDLIELSLEGSYEEDGDEVEESALPALFHSIAQLSRLEALTLEVPLPASFISSSLLAPLKKLSLRETGPSTTSAFRTLISNFSQTLEHLELRYVLPYDETANPDDPPPASPSPPEPPFPLPHLTHLTMASAYYSPPTLLPLFTLSPLRIFRLEDCSPHAFDLVLSSLQSHVRTLKRIEVVSAEFYSTFMSTERTKLKEWCEGAGVEFGEVEAEKEDSETEEGDYLSDYSESWEENGSEVLSAEEYESEESDESDDSEGDEWTDEE
ncbi:hypothetical protein JCM10213_007786 [Rhodosporidiobolus nylandii]